ncbi:hypothetical protein IFM89_006435 [Coptis chinensis]|uniref:DUF2921 domain-containing protein n=1 Tax=Coptis chinensis TaxID=261450 RepID=A0A835HRG1_9MAGN|nr:hypothetical protein IFM89_006435 [Coptis chinensis]
MEFLSKLISLDSNMNKVLLWGRVCDSVNYFEPISVLTFSPRNYEHSLVVDDSESGFSGGGGVAKDSMLSLGPRISICSELYWWSRVFELEYGSNCDATKNCSPVASSIGDLPEFMSFSELQCSNEQRLRLLIRFSNTSHAVYRDALAPSTMLVGEGHWNGDYNPLHIAACRFLNYTDSLANISGGDCLIRLSVWYRSSVVEQIWSNKTSNESGYFDKIVFQSPVNRIYPSPGLKYEYTKTGGVVKSCAKKTAAKKGVIYPSGYSYDMKFDMRVRNSKGAQSWGYSVPLSVGDQFYEQGVPIIEFDAVTPESSVQVIHKHLKGLLNVSYSLSLAPDYNVGGAPF